MMAEPLRPADSALVAQTLEGDRESYGVLVRRHSRSLFALAFRVTGNQQDADEVVQETFLRAFKSLSRFEQRADFGSWLYRIALNCALDLKGKRRPEVDAMRVSESPAAGEPRIQLVSPAANQEQSVYGDQVKAKVAEAMGTLTKVERAAFVMRHLEGRTLVEIAGLLGSNPNAIKNTVFRAVHKLRQELAPLVSIT